MLKSLACAGAILAATCFGSNVQAASTVDLETSAGTVIPVFGGCGPYGHRGPYGGCRAGGQFGGYIPGRACPFGFHLGPYGHHCFPNRF